VAASLGGANRSDERRVENDERHARQEVDADDAEAVVGVEEEVLVAADARRQDVEARLRVRRRDVVHPLRHFVLSCRRRRVLVVRLSVLRHRDVVFRQNVNRQVLVLEENDTTPTSS